MRQTDFRQAFNVGELSEDAWSRSDLVQHSKGCALAWNMIAQVTGPMRRRPGTWFCGLTKHQDRKGRLVPFRRTGDEALVLEFNHLSARVWTVNGTPVMSGGAQVEFAHLWTEAQLPGLRWRQSGDVIYFTHRDNLSPRVVRRNSDVSWTFDGLGFVNGPFRGENVNTGHTLTLSGTSLTASTATFQPGHVGSLWRLRAGDGNPGVLSWEPEEQDVPPGALRLSNGRVYRRVGTADDTGNTPPLHESGTVSDGKVDWEYVHDGAAVMIVTGYTSPTAVTVTVLTGVPEGLDSGTPYWSESAYSDVRGWPTANPAIREERLVLAGGLSEPDALNLTRTAGFNATTLDFKPGLGTGRVVDDDAVRRFIGGDRDRVVWMEGSTFLMAGTTAGEFLISGATLDDPISPSGCVSRPVNDFGSADVMPALAFGGLLFVAAGGETLRRVSVLPDQSVDQRDLSVVAGHIAGRGMVELTWLKQPLNLLWIQLSDGGQASFTYHDEQKVEGWARHGLAALGLPTPDQPLGGGLTLESSCVVPGPNGRPRLFMIASRIKNGATQRMILRMADPGDRLFLDMAEAYVGTAVNAVSGLDHLSGETATLMAATEAGAAPAPGAGWGEYVQRPVSGGGSAALPEGLTATRIYAGAPYRSRWEGLPPDIGGPGGTAGRRVDYKRAAIVLKAAVAWAGTTGDEGDAERDRLLSRQPGDVAGPVERRQTWRPVLLGGSGYERRYFVETDSGFDLILYSIRAEAEVN